MHVQFKRGRVVVALPIVTESKDSLTRASRFPVHCCTPIHTSFTRHAGEFLTRATLDQRLTDEHCDRNETKKLETQTS